MIRLSLCRLKLRPKKISPNRGLSYTRRSITRSHFSALNHTSLWTVADESRMGWRFSALVLMVEKGRMELSPKYHSCPREYTHWNYRPFIRLIESTFAVVWTDWKELSCWKNCVVCAFVKGMMNGVVTQLIFYTEKKLYIVNAYWNSMIYEHFW